MKYLLKPTKFFLSQLEGISFKSKQLLKKKLKLIQANPSRNKRILGYNLFLFRIRFKDRSKEKRVIYMIDKNKIKILCILNRNKNYKDLKRYLKKLGYL